MKEELLGRVRKREVGVLSYIKKVNVREKGNFLKSELKMERPFGPMIPLLRIYLENPKTPIQKNLCTPVFIAALFTIAKCWKQLKYPSVDEWVKKTWYIYTMEYYIAKRMKKEFLPFVIAWMEVQTIMLSEINQ